VQFAAQPAPDVELAGLVTQGRSACLSSGGGRGKSVRNQVSDGAWRQSSAFATAQVGKSPQASFSKMRDLLSKGSICRGAREQA